MQASRVLRAAEAAAKKPRYVRRPLTRADFQFSLVLGFSFIPAIGLFYFNDKARAYLAPYFQQAKQRFNDVAPDFWLTLEQLSNRDGEVSEGLRKKKAESEGKEYKPLVEHKIVPPSKDEVKALLNPRGASARFDSSLSMERHPDQQLEQTPRRASSGPIDLSAMVAAAEAAKRRS